MTDDERMDRARRIREMREGARPDDEAQDDDRDADADVTEAEADGGPDAADDPADGAVESDSEPSTAGTVGEADGSNADETDGSSADEAAEAVANLDIDERAVGGGADGAEESEGGGTIHIPGADVGDVDVDVEEMARQAGLSSAEGESEAEDAELGIGATGAAGRAAAAEEDTGEETRVLEFSLGDEQYCLDIEYVEEIVKRETVTRVPNTPDCVEGVVDLRGQITTILDPKVLLDIPESGSKDLIVVFDPEAFDDQGAVGWVVDDVNQVTPITEEEVNDSPVDQDHINGVVDRDGEFVIWTTPELDLDEVTG